MSLPEVLTNGKTWEVLQGDCLEVMKTLPDASVDAIVTDPPYNLGFAYALTSDHRPDYEAWCASWFSECLRLCRGPIAVSCGIVNVGMWWRIAPPEWILCWWKPAAMGRCSVGFNNWEPVLLYGKSKGRKGCDVVQACIKPDSALAGHPCPKPLEWGKGFVNLLTRSGDLVLDPFMGSGTTGVAALQTGRRFLGIELDPGYFTVAEKRVRDAATDGPLFAVASTVADERTLFDSSCSNGEV